MKTATIKIIRGDEAFGICRKLKVFIDEAHVGDVQWNKSVDLQVSAGEHVIYVKMDWCRSAPTNITMTENKEVEFEVTTPSTGSWLKIFAQMYAMIFASSHFYGLKKR